jgi:hypothetical protein
MNWSIYGLKDPRTSEVRYIGATSGKLRVRLYNHITEALAGCNTLKNRWLLSLLRAGHKPIIELLESGSDDGCEAAEQKWILTFRRKNGRLTNMTDGGDGCPGRRAGGPRRNYKQSAIRNAKLAALGRSQAGRILSEETRALIAEARRGSKASPETRRKMSQTHSKRYQSPDARVALSKMALSRWAKQRARTVDMPKAA